MRKTLFAFTVASLLSFGMAAAQTRQPQSDNGSEPGTLQQTAPQATSRITQTGTKPAAGTHTVSYKDRTQYDFDDDEVEGGTKGPDGVVISGKLAPRFESMLKIRPDFKPEMYKSVDTL
jgi:hypothetical protein